MLRDQVVEPRNGRIEFSLDPDDLDRYEALLRARGGKKGPFAKALVLREMDAAGHLGDGSTEAREMAATLAVHAAKATLETREGAPL